MSSGLEAAPYSVGIEPVCFDAIDSQAATEESDTRALFLEATEELESRQSHGSRQSIHGIDFDHQLGALRLTLREKKVLTKLMSREQLGDLRSANFKPVRDMHITVLDGANGHKIIDALGGRKINGRKERKHLGAIMTEAAQIDWRWRPIGEPFPFKRQRSGYLKIMSLVDCPGIDELFGVLEDGLPGLQLERSLAHVALMYRRSEKMKQSGAKIGGIAIGQPLTSVDLKQPTPAL